MIRKYSLIIVALLALLSCSENRKQTEPKVEVIENEFVVVSDYQNLSLPFTTSPTCSFEKVANPLKDEVNKSSKCAMVTCGGEQWEFIYSDLLPRMLDFTKNAPIFKMKVFAPREGVKVYFKIEPEQLDQNSVPALEVQNVVTTKAQAWEELEFDFSDYEPESNMYRKIVLVFDAGEQTIAGEKWYFDDITIPSDDLSSLNLMKRYEGNPVFVPDGVSEWRGAHMANAAIITPADSPDGNWWLYLRGTGFRGGTTHDQIGLYKQNAADFKPFGPWDEYKANPVIKNGGPGSFDEKYILDGVPIIGKDNVFYIYYKAATMDFKYSTGLAYSLDGYNFTKMDKPKIGGAGDAMYYGGKYYAFSGEKVYVADDPEFRQNRQTYTGILPGGGPSNFDNKILWGTMVFRLKDVDKWFMTYQASATHVDFPDRFHVAMSDDLLHWTKVDNKQPFFTRGSRGEWDQGGIWYPEVIEYQDKLYLYYEGWGKEGYVENRDIPYFDGRSCTGAAWVEKSEFLKWCGLI